MFEGTLKEKDNGSFAGFFANTEFDVEVSARKSDHKTEDKHPDYIVYGKSPRGRDVRIGSIWEQSGKESGLVYLSISLTIKGQRYRNNAFQRDDNAWECAADA